MFESAYEDARESTMVTIHVPLFSKVCHHGNNHSLPPPPPHRVL